MPDRLKTGFAILAVVAAFTLLVLSVRSVKPEEDAGLALRPVGEAPLAGEFTLPEAGSGRRVSLEAETHQHPVLLDFWATWCGPCRAELPHLSDLSRKYAGRVAFYGVNSNDTPASITAFAQQTGMAFPTLSDASQTAAANFHADALPTLVILDRQGRVRVYAQGYDPGIDVEQALSKILDTLVAEK